MAAIDYSKLTSKKSLPAREVKGITDFFNQDISFGSKQLTDKKKEGFYNELGTLIRSGIDIKTALELTATSYKHPKDKILLDGIRSSVIAGKGLSETLEAKMVFSKYEYYSVKIGEETSRLGEVLGELSNYFKAKINQRRKIIAAITYPALVLSTSIGAIFFMIKFVVPMFADVFKRFGGKLPYVTSVIVRFSDWLDRYIFLLLFIILGVVIFYFLNRNKLWYQKYSTEVFLKIPLVGEILRKVYLARLANTMRLLTGTNTPLIQSLSMVNQMIAFYPIEVSLKAAEIDILGGKTLSEALAKHEFYPEKFVQMIRIAEEVNKLEYFFFQLAEQYTQEVEYQTNTISSILEPLIIIFLGLAVGVILIAMYLPMFQMSNSF